MMTLKNTLSGLLTNRMAYRLAIASDVFIDALAINLINSELEIGYVQFLGAGDFKAMMMGEELSGVTAREEEVYFIILDRISSLY